MISKGDLVQVIVNINLDQELGIVFDHRKDVLGGSCMVSTRDLNSNKSWIHKTEKRSEFLVFTPLNCHMSWYDEKLIKKIQRNGKQK